MPGVLSYVIQCNPKWYLTHSFHCQGLGGKVLIVSNQNGKLNSGTQKHNLNYVS